MQTTRVYHLTSSLTPLETRGDKAVHKVHEALVERRHVLAVGSPAGLAGAANLLQTDTKTMEEILALARGVFNGLLARQTAVKDLAVRGASHDRHGSSEEDEKEREEGRETHRRWVEGRQRCAVRRGEERKFALRGSVYIRHTAFHLHTGIYLSNSLVPISMYARLFCILPTNKKYFVPRMHKNM